MTPEALAALHATAFRTPRPWNAGEIANLTAAPEVFVIAAPGEMILGRVILDEAELLTLAVTPGRRRAGRGRALLCAFEAEARARGAARAFLEVAADNAPALGLYRALGWEQAGRRVGYYRAPDKARIDALIFVKPLT